MTFYKRNRRPLFVNATCLCWTTCGKHAQEPDIVSQPHVDVNKSVQPPKYTVCRQAFGEFKYARNLLLEGVSDLQLHQQHALAHVQGLVEIGEGGVDVLFDGTPLTGQLLQDVSQRLPGLCHLW